MEGSVLGLRRTLRRVPASQKNELYAWYPTYEYPGTAVVPGTWYVFCISRHHLFCGQLLVLRAAPGFMGRAQGRSPSPQSFSEDCSNVWGEVREVRHLLRLALQKNERSKNLVLHTWYLIYEHQVLLCTCFVFEGTTFIGQLLAR